MATYKYIANTSDPLYEVEQILDSSGYFDSVDRDIDENNLETLTCTKNSVTVLTWTYAAAASNPNYNVSITLGGNTVSTNFTGSSNKEYMKPYEAYICTGGILIMTGLGYNDVIITENQNGDLSMIMGTATTYTANQTRLTSTTAILSSADGGGYKTKNLNPTDGNQTLLVPLCTRAGFDQLTYTDTVRFVYDRQYNITGYIIYNNKRYFTNGTFAIEDTPSN